MRKSAVFAVLLAAAMHTQEPTAAEREYGTIIGDYNRAIQAAAAAKNAPGAASGKAGEVAPPDVRLVVRRLLAVAAKYPEDPAAIDCLLSVVGFDVEDTTDQALRQLARHPGEPRLWMACQSVADAHSSAAEEFLRFVIAKSPHRQAQGWAHYALARLCTRKPGEEAQQESKALFARVQRDFADVPNDDQTLGASAKADLEEMQRFGIGRMAPDIAGEDVSGAKFRLADYRGKVIFLDFWGFW